MGAESETNIAGRRPVSFDVILLQLPFSNFLKESPMKRITLALLFCVVFTPNFLRAQTDGIAELNVYGSISVVEGFVADPPTETWVLAEFNDTLGIVGYSDALIDSSTGEILAVNELDFTYTDPNSLSMNLYTPGSPEPFATIIVIEDDGVIHELTDQNPDPPNEPNLGPLTTNEKWLRDKVLGVTSQDNPKIFPNPTRQEPWRLCGGPFWQSGNY